MPSLPAASLETLASRIRRATEEGLGFACQSVERFWTVGSLLMQAKEQLTHGQWGAWVEEHCCFNVRTASRYMMLAKSYESAAAARQGVAEIGKLVHREKEPTLEEPAPARATSPLSPTAKAFVEENATEAICDLVDAGKLPLEQALTISRLDDAEQQAAAALLTHHEGPIDAGTVADVLDDVAAKAKREPVYDSAGTEVPRRLREVFADPFWQQTLATVQEAYHHVKAHEKRYRWLLRQDFALLLVQLEDLLRDCRPGTLCSDCRGKGCETCLEAGWLCQRDAG